MLMQRKCHTPARKSRVVNGGIDPSQRAMSFDRRGESAYGHEMSGKYFVDAPQLRYDALKSRYTSRFTDRLPHRGLASAVWNDNCIYRRSSNARPRRHIEVAAGTVDDHHFVCGRLCRLCSAEALSLVC